MVIQDIVDETIFYFLLALEERNMSATFNPAFIGADDKPQSIQLEAGDEIGGRYVMHGGWRMKYSSEPVNDNCSDTDFSQLSIDPARK